MRKRYIQDPKTLKLVPASLYVKPGEHHMIMPDIKPYRSIVDGSEISSRSRHREHLQRHGCEEVGNEFVTSKPQVDERKERDQRKRAIADALSGYGI